MSESKFETSSPYRYYPSLIQKFKGDKKLSLIQNRSSKFSKNKSSLELKTLADSKLTWFILIAILVLWVLNVSSTYSDYQSRIEKEIVTYEQSTLDAKRLEIEAIYRSIYEHIRTISLLPSIRRVSGENRYSVDENVVNQGRLSLDTHQTIQQIYRNLNNSVELSEIYFILKGFEPDKGQVPFFMYDDAILGQNILNFEKLGISEELVAEEYELDEYRYYQTQLSWYEEHYPEWVHTNDITRIPAVFSPLMRTCDNTQYIDSEKDNVRNTHGMLYSVPVFSLVDHQFTGLISAVIRANVIESILLDVPFIPITAQDAKLAASIGLKMPEEVLNYLLVNTQNDVEIYDRRNKYLVENTKLVSDDRSKYRVSSMNINIVGDSSWRLYNYLTATQIEQLTQKLEDNLFNEIVVRFLLLLIMAAIFFKAVRDQRRHQNHLIEMAHFDGLTKLPNRRLLYSNLEIAIERARLEGTYLGLMFLDIDDFGVINDTMSHRIGDIVLKNIANRLAHHPDAELSGSPEDFCIPMPARLGGDDFALIFEDLPNPGYGINLGEQQMEKFREPMVIEGQVFDISLTAGMAVFPDDANDIHELMASADYALRHAMDYGSGQFQMFNDDMRRNAARQNRLLRDLTDAIRTRGFSVYYQPKQSLDNDRVFSFEALMRWNHPELGFVSPVEFIPLLEQTGQIVEAGRWILEESCKQLKQWKNDGYVDVHISVNVSAKQLLLSDMVLTVETILDNLELSANSLILEITESLMIDNILDSSRILDRIRSRGVKLAIDDFGTGYSSLTYLQGLPVDYLKLDKSMIDVMDDARGEHVTRATIDLAHGLGLKTIAEGVEDEIQRQKLKEMGCDMIQGYLLSKPLPAEELEPFLLLSNPVVES